MGTRLDRRDIERFASDGFLVVEDAVDPAACAALRDRALAIVDGFEPTEQRTTFTTNDQARVSNAEFLGSGDGIWCFFEEEAFTESGSLRQDKRLSINKIGRAMHDLDPVFEAFTYTPLLAGVAHDVGLAAPLALQSMYIFKQPNIGGEVGCHQDGTFLWTEPLTVTGFWFAIEDATIENGCLWAAPGGHRGPLRSRFRRRHADGSDGTVMETLDPTPLPRTPDDLVPLEVRAGTLVALHGLLPHWSDVNRSPRSRHAYSVHCIEDGAAYPEWNWLQRPGLPLRRLDAVTT
jgi:phytanoyl-CoA hydroxylase